VNKIFSEYSTSTAFLIQLSKRQVWGLLALQTGGKRDLWLESGQFIALGRTLAARGLVEHKDEKPYWRLTKAGELMCLLLREAGLDEKNTKTVSVIKGLMQWAGRKAA